MNEALSEPTASQPLPHSVEAEQAVLGGLMLKNDALIHCIDHFRQRLLQHRSSVNL